MLLKIALSLKYEASVVRVMGYTDICDNHDLKNLHFGIVLMIHVMIVSTSHHTPSLPSASLLASHQLVSL